MAEQHRATRIGVDEWAARIGSRRQAPGRIAGWAQRRWERIPVVWQVLIVVAAAATVPLLTDSSYIERVGVNTLLFALVVVGLNVAVGWAGLLDLSYVAFYGLGAYTYALLSSDHFDVHLPAELTIPAAALLVSAIGMLLALTARRLRGHYFAVVTLFFSEIFLTVATNGDRIPIPGGEFDLTGGASGIPGVDPVTAFGAELTTLPGYYWLTLGLGAVAILGFSVFRDSRTGRALRATKEDALAAEAMGIPVHRLRVLAIGLGAGTAAISGTLFAAVGGGTFPQDFDLNLLITVYVMLILGGTGSLWGAALGAVAVNVLLEALRTPDPSRWVFYGLLLLALVVYLRPWRALAAVLAGTALLGIVVRVICASVGFGVEPAETGGALGEAVRSWVLMLPADQASVGDYAFLALIALAVALVIVQRRLLRIALLVPTLYLAAFTWENVLVKEPSVTRYLILGAVLVGAVIVRPQGVLGTRRVETPEDV